MNVEQFNQMNEGERMMFIAGAEIGGLSNELENHIQLWLSHQKIHRFAKTRNAKDLKFNTMKTFFSALFIAIGTTISAQNAILTSDGNFKAISATKTTFTDSTTTKTFTSSNGAVERVYVGAKGSYYLARISKSGNYYRKYLKVEAGANYAISNGNVRELTTKTK